jgi:hypothetical protein
MSKSVKHLKTKNRSKFTRFCKHTLQYYTGEAKGVRNYDINASRVEEEQSKNRRPLETRVFLDWWECKIDEKTGKRKWKVAFIQDIFRYNPDLLKLDKSGKTDIQASLSYLNAVALKINKSLSKDKSHLTILIENCPITKRTWHFPASGSSVKTFEEKLEESADSVMSNPALKGLFD